MEPSMNEIKRIAVDTSKSVFTVHGTDDVGRAVLRRNLRRRELVGFFEKLPAVDVAMEACGGSHHWGRVLSALGHRVRLIPAQYVKPFVKRAKNDRNDAEAISEAASRPSMHTVPVKSAQTQASAMLLTVRELLVRQRTQLVNALRGHAAEFGLVAAKGDKGLATLRREIACKDDLPVAALEALALLGDEIDRIAARLGPMDKALAAQHKENGVSRLLAEIPGVETFEILREASPKNDYRHGISMEFAGSDAYAGYNEHPDHVRFVEERWLSEVAAFLEADYESL